MMWWKLKKQLEWFNYPWTITHNCFFLLFLRVHWVIVPFPAFAIPTWWVYLGYHQKKTNSFVFVGLESFPCIKVNISMNFSRDRCFSFSLFLGTFSPLFCAVVEIKYTTHMWSKLCLHYFKSPLTHFCLSLQRKFRHGSPSDAQRDGH